MLISAAKISILLPMQGRVNFYNDFILQYSILISSNMIIYELVSESNEDKIFDLFQSYHSMFNDYDYISNILPVIGIQMEVPQQEEIRGLILDKFFVEMMSKKYSPKQILFNYINLKEFVVLYALFEGILKEEFIRCGLIDENKYLREKDIIEYIKKKYKYNLDKLNDILESRSIYNLGSIESWWKFYTHFRHLIFHNGGKITRKWKNFYDNLKSNLIENLKSEKSNESFLEIINILDNLEKIDNSINIDEYFFLSDEFTNMFRDFVINLMESMYLLDVENN